jgi:hypothetical protein
LGGAYPGKRRPAHNPYTPGENEFDKVTGQAVVHFKAYGGGNALTLVKQDGSAQPQSGPGGKPGGPQYIQGMLVFVISNFLQSCNGLSDIDT